MIEDRCNGRRILVVDDDSTLCETLKMLLELWGNFVVAANSGSAALELFGPGKFDLVITDYMMPVMTGDKLAATIKALSPSQPILMLSAYAGNFSSGNPISSCVDGIIAKPFKLDTLQHAVFRLCTPLQQLS